MTLLQEGRALIAGWRKRGRRLRLSPDAFSDGQMASKLWLCDELERLLQHRPGPHLLTVYAGWYGLLPLLLFSRERVPIAKINLFDWDREAVANALRVNDRWRLDGRFHAEVRDVNEPITNRPDATVFINTSCEHFRRMDWWQTIPSGALVALQSTDMRHPEHFRRSENLAQFKASLGPFARVEYQGQRDFKYGDFAFSRFMIIGEKA